MARIRDNFQSGVLGSGLTIAGTSMASAELAAFPVVATGDNAVIVLDPNGEFGKPEIVYLTAHAAGATTGTILRGQEGTTARAHGLNTPWINGIAASELNNFIENNGTQTVTGSLLLTAGSATTIPLAVKAAASQTGNLQEWRSSANAILARVSSAGAIYGAGVYDGANRVYSASNPVPDNALYAHLAGAETFTGLKTFSAGATFSAGTVLIGTTTAGTLTIGNGTITKSGSAGFTFNSTLVATGADINGYMDVFSGTAASVALSVSGAASQTANLQEWRNSAATVLSRVDAAGLIYEGANRVFSAANPNLTSSTPDALTFGQAGAVGTGTASARSDHAHAMPATPVTSAVAGTGISVSAATGAVTFANTGVLSVAVVNNATAAVASGAVTITNSLTPTFTSVSTDIARMNNSNPAIVPLIVGAVAAQTANLQEWHDPADAVIARVSATGAIYGTGVYDGAGRVYSAINNNMATTVNSDVTYGEAAAVGTSTLYAHGDHSHGTPPTPVTSLAVTNNATVSGSTGAVTITNSLTPTYTTIAAARATLTNTSTTGINLVMQRVAAQTANIAEWRNESGVVLGRIASDGTIYVGTMAYSATGSIAAAAVTIDTTQTITGVKTFSTMQNFDAGLALTTGVSLEANTTTTYTPITVNGMKGSSYAGFNFSGPDRQFMVSPTKSGIYTGTAWQWSWTSGVLTDGFVPASRVTEGLFDAGAYGFASDAATAVPLYIRGFASQTGDLLQFKNSSGTILARVASDGTFYKGTQVVGGNASDTETMGIMGAL